MRKPGAPGTNEDLQEKLAANPTDAKNSGKVVQSLGTQLANALTLAARTAPAAPQALNDRPEVSQLPRIFRVRSYVVDKRDFSTHDSNVTEASQLS
jgi:hypothetical protein